MKKILIPFLVFSAIVGCKKDSGSSSQLPADLKRVTKSINTDFKKNETTTFTVSYTDNQIIMEGSRVDVSGNVKETIKEVYTYQAGKLVEETTHKNDVLSERNLFAYDAEGNLSSKTHYGYNDKGDNAQSTGVYTYTYAGGKVSEEEISEKEPTYVSKRKKIYKHSGNTIKTHMVRYDNTTGQYADIDETSYTLYTYENNGNLLSEQYFYNNELRSSTKKEYDNKMSYNAIMLGVSNPTGIPIAKNNVTKTTYSNGRSGVSVFVNTYQYNSEGYPTEIISYDENNAQIFKTIIVY